MRVAIIGQGPRGVYALAELLARWPDDRTLEVHCYDPQLPGCGAAYHLAQPDYLRLNVSPRIVHLPPNPPLVEWLHRRGVDPQADVPRRLVGAYLAEAREALLRDPRPGVTVTLHTAAVEYLSHEQGTGWLVAADMPQVVDEVLLAVGHCPSHDHQLANSWADDRIRLVDGVYPVQDKLSLEAVPPGSQVAVRGASLTFIDVVLALVEGRAPQDRPRVIRPIARTGLLMGVKPAVGADLLPDEELMVQTFVRTMPSDPNGVLDTVRTVATQLLVLGGETATHAARQVELTLQLGCEPDLDGPGRALRSLHRSIAVAEGAERPGAGAMLGRAWQALYPTIVARLSYSRPDAAAWQRFLAAAAVLEKFAFGPLLPNAIRLAGLCQRGVVDLSWLEGGVRATDRLEGLPPDAELPDVIVDAVLSPPGAVTARHPLVDQLLAEGRLRLAEGQRGVDVTRQAQCLAADGLPTPGLSAVGRVAEDVVIGHDTLSRGLHPEIGQWAERITQHQEAHR